MNDFLSRFADVGQSWLDRQPDLALMLGAAAAVFWLRWLQLHAATLTVERFWQNLVLRTGLALGATALTTALICAHAGLRGYLQSVDRNFSAHHGRITEANRRAVETIWGQPQRQADLSVWIGYDEEVEERVQAAELDKPDIIHKIKKHTAVTDNPFRQERHQIRLNANPRRKGSAMYAGYETDCRFYWKMANPAARDTEITLSLPLPAADAVYFDLAATWNGVDVLPQVRFDDNCLILRRNLAAHEAFDFHVAFRSRGLETWYFQNDNLRELRDFELTVDLTDIPLADLNYPEGCMTPTEAAAAGAGSRLLYRLDHTLSAKGMGVALPKLEQPGQALSGILSEAPRGWTLFFALLWLGLTVAGGRGSGFMTLVCSIPIAFGYGLMADWTDAGLDWYWAFLLAVMPFVGLTVAVVRRRLGPVDGWILAAPLTLMAVGYPLGAGLDDGRFMMYRNLAGLLFLGTVVWLAVRRGQLGAAPADAATR